MVQCLSNLTLCTFSFKIKKVACPLQDVVSSHCVTRCCITTLCYNMLYKCITTLLQDVVSPHCVTRCCITTLCYKMLYHHTGDKRMVLRCMIFSVPNYFVMMSWYWIAGGMHQCKQRKQSDCLMFIFSYYVSQIHGHIIISKGIFSIFPATMYSPHFSKRSVVR